MEKQSKTLIRRRLTGFFLTIVMVLSLFGEFATTAYAGSVVGSSGYINATGAQTGIAGGVSHIQEAVFRVGVMRDKGLWNNTSPQAEKDILTAWSHRFPDNNLGESSLFFTPNGFASMYDNYELGEYSSGVRRILKFSDTTSLARVQNLSSNPNTKPQSVGKDALEGYSFGGGTKTKKFDTLKGGKWETIAATITPAQANATWSYILADVDSGSGVRYDIQNRIHTMISPHANKDLTKSTVTDAQREDVARGYLGLLMTTWRIVPKSLREPWASAIEDYLTGAKQAKGEQPSALVIDTAMTMSFTSTGKRLVIPTIDYFQYYTAVGAKWDITKTTNLGSAGGDTYAMLLKIVENDYATSGALSRTSSNYDPSNPFAWGAGAIAYPWKRFSTSGSNPRWADTNLATAQMDILTLGKPTSSKTLRGFITVGYSLIIPDKPVVKDTVTVEEDKIPTDEEICIPYKDPACTNEPPGQLRATFTATPDNHIVAATSEVIGKPVTLTVRHPDNPTVIATWQNIFKADPNLNTTVNIKITPTRTEVPKAQIDPNYRGSIGNLTGGHTMTRGDFLKFLQGAITLFINDTSSVNEPIARGSTKTYNYRPLLDITYTLNGATKHAYQRMSDTASFKRQNPPPDPITYVSDPSAYAEIKEGTPDNESFEAMSGVPSNKRLYLGVGGSEFIVDVELEYKQNVDSVWRTYRSHYTAVDSEHKAGDTAPSKTVGGNSVDPHAGGTTTKTWSGTIPWTGSHSASGWHGGSVTNTWDYAAQIAAKAEADAWAATVNGTVISHTSVSEPQTRNFSAWGATVTGGKVEGTAGTWTDGKDPVPEVPDNPATPGVNEYKPAEPGVPAKSTAGTAGSYSYTVTGTVPAHAICGPECTYVLPAIQDTWKQKINFDYMKISRVEVYKIEEGRITSVDNLFGEGNSELKATIKSTDPSLFANIAQKNAGGDDVAAQSSKMGRLRYSLDTNQHDTVVYDEGPRTNKSAGQGTNGVAAAIGQTHARAKGILYTNGGNTITKDYHATTANATDKARPEYIKFNQRRTALNKATVISDMLILQTSGGDQSVMYFAKDSVEKQAQEQFPDLRATKVEMWDNNPNSAAKWKTDQINVGSYNGNYLQTGDTSATNKKYHAYNQASQSYVSSTSLATAFDSNGVGVNGATPRPSRPSKLYIYGDRAIEPTTQNASYITGDAEVYYKRVLNWRTPNPYPELPGTPLQDEAYTSEVQANFSSGNGLVIAAPYSDNHDKVNDVVVHTPVSVEDAMIVSLGAERDQRTETPPGGAASLIQQQNDLKVCPLDPALCEFRVLNCKHRMDIELANIDFSNFTAGTILNKTTGAYIPYSTSSGITMSPKAGFGSGNVLNAFGTRWSLNFADIGVTNDKTTTILVEMDFFMPTAPPSGDLMVVSFYGYDFYITEGASKATFNTGNGVERRLNGTNFVGTQMRLGLQFSFGHIDDSKVFINGVEQTSYTRLNESSDVTGLIGTQLNIGSWGLSDQYKANFYVDNLKVTRKGGTLEHTNSCYITTVTHETKWTHVHDASCSVTEPAVNNTYNYTGGVQTFTAPYTGNFTLETWGAQGGNATYTQSNQYACNNSPLNSGYSSGSWVWCHHSHNYPQDYTPYQYADCTSECHQIEQGGGYTSHTHDASCGYTTGFTNTANGGAGGYSKGEVKLNKGEVVYIYVGAQGTTGDGTSTYAGGWNGGGTGNYYSGGGGGATDIRRGGQALTNRIIVAGGGGGAQAYTSNGYKANGGTGGGTAGGNGTTHGAWTTAYTTTGGTQSGSGTGTYWNLPSGTDFGGSYSGNWVGGGGGGYFGGHAGTYMGYSGSGGSGYTGSLTNSSMQNGVKTGNGQVKITAIGGATTFKCNNLPLNLLTQNNVHVHDASCITEITPKGSEVETTATPTTFDYTGSTQQFTAPVAGTYILETWGAEGGSATSADHGYGIGTANGGKGGYSKGSIALNAGETIYIHVGGKGGAGGAGVDGQGGYNGGGRGALHGSGGGGGATDIRKGGTAISNRIIVAGGGGGGQTMGSGYSATGGEGGGLTGGNGSFSRYPGWGSTSPYTTYGGTQTNSPANNSWENTPYYIGYQGQGGHPYSSYIGGGGGGYWGGNSGSHHGWSGGGGSGYIGGVTNGTLDQGVRTGNGSAKITLDSNGFGNYTYAELLGPTYNNYLTTISTPHPDAGKMYTYNFTGAAQTFAVPTSGKYRLEVWGAQGGYGDSSWVNETMIDGGGRGAYAKGEIDLTSGTNLSLYIGGYPGMNQIGGWNGGGTSHYYFNGHYHFGGGGGGATDIRLGGTALTNRIIVAGGGGGVAPNSSTLTRGAGYSTGSGNSAAFGDAGTGTQVDTNNQGIGAAHSSGNLKGNDGTKGTLGQGGTAGTHSNQGYGGYIWAVYGGGGGGGYYGGGGSGAGPIDTVALQNWSGGSGGGGSSYIGTLTNATATTGTSSMPNPSGGTMVGNAGHGKLRITFIDSPTVTQTLDWTKISADADKGIFPKTMSDGKPNPILAKFGLNGYTFAEIFGVDWKNYTDTTKTIVNWAKVKQDVATANFPKTLADGNANPIFEKDAFTYNVHVHSAGCVTTRTLSCSEPHHTGTHYDGSNPICWDACGDDHNHKQLKPTAPKPDGSTVQAGSFVNLDYPFQIYFPNRGDFAQQPTLRGIGALSTSRGKGYVNSMDTTQYTHSKRVRFEFNVAFNNVIHTAGSWIELPVNQDTFDFYTVLANSEAIGSSVHFDATPINGSPIGMPENDNFSTTTNRERNYDFSAYHGAFKETYVDVVGRIGNFAASDTEDFRFSNLFKQDVGSGGWIVEGLVPEVDSFKQNRFYGDLYDVRGLGVNSTGFRLDTYGSQPWLQKAPLSLPINPKDNASIALKEQFLKVGYDVLADIQTIGNYQDGVVRALPYYYKLNLDNGIITPLDAYVKSGESYQPVNIYRGADGGTLPPNLYPYELVLDWENESSRRNYTMDESVITDRVSQKLGEYVLGPITLPDGTTEQGVINTKPLTTPIGNYVSVGNAQRIIVDKKARTFIGSPETYKVNRNYGNAIPLNDWEAGAQRWHMKVGLPSSTVFVASGMPVNKTNLDNVKSGNAVVLLAMDVISVGDYYSLRWQQPGVSAFTVSKGGATRTFNIAGSGLPPVVALYDLNQTAIVDVTVKGSH